MRILRGANSPGANVPIPHRVTRRIVAACTLGSTLAGLSANGQQGPAAAPTESPELQEIVVTGSYIPRTDRETVSPVTFITSADIVNSGLTTVADVVRTLSSDNSGTLPTAFPGAFAAGASGVALRGLTVNSTLVLIDGLRAADYALPDDGIRSFVDLNSLQIGTIDHVEVLKDGASSVYGADAIAGVVNIILKKTYEGFNASVEVGDSQHGGGFEKHFDMTAGHGNLEGDHYNAYFSVEYQADNLIGVNERPYPFDTNDYTPFGGFNNNLSPDHGPGGSIYGSVTPGTITNGNVLTGVPLPGAVSQPLTPCPASAPEITGPTGNKYCNQNQTTYLEDQPATTRVGVAGRITVQFNDDMTGYLHASYYQNQSQYPTSTGPSQIQTTSPNLTTTIALPPTIPVPGMPGKTMLNPNDPFAALGEAALINYAFGPEGPQMNYVKNRNARLVADLSGKWQDWNYSADLVLNHTWLDYELGGELNYSQLVSDVTNGTYNFIDPSANSPAVLGALAPRAVTQDTSDMDTVVLRANRQLFPLPGGPLALALGAEWRYEAEYDQNFQSNPPEVQNLGYSQAIGNRTVESVDAELDLPVLKSLELTASGRYDHYSDFGSTTNPKFGVKFKPIDMLMARATYSRGFRAPSFAENGSSEVEGFINYGACPSPLCTAHGADGYISSYSLGELTTANPAIKPETSDSYTAGLVFEPIKQFSASADYYYIKKNNLITGPNQNGALAQYANGMGLPAGYTAIYDNPDSAYPGAAPRIVTITAPYSNAASEYTDGVDLDLQGHFDLGSVGNFGSLGKIDTDLSITKILAFVYEQVGSPNLEYVGLQSPYNLSSGAGTPQWRGTFTNTWTDGPVRVSVNVYYVSGYKEYGEDVFGPSFGTCSTAYTVGFTPQDCRVASFTDVDLTGAYNINDHLQVSFVVENLLDRLPPFDPLTYAATNYNPTYSQAGIVGRFFRLGAHVKF
jgi:iron complex outermembrane recepter protein